MKNIVELSESIQEARQEVEQIVALATREDRELTDAEAQRSDELVAQIQKDEEARERRHKLDGELKARGAEKLAGQIGGGSGPSMHTDSRGREYAVLSSTDKVADIYRPQCENAFGHYVIGKLFGTSRATPSPVVAALSESDNTLGGFLVPDQMMGEVIDLARARSVMMAAGTRTIPMSTETLTVPVLESDVTVNTSAENQTITASNLTFGQREMSTHTAAALTKISRELWEDSPQLLASQIENWLSAKMALQIDEWGLSGTGSAQPQGILNFSGIGSTGSVGAIDWTDVSAAATEVRKNNHTPNSVIMNTEIAADLMEIETGDGTNAARGWLGAPPTLQGVQMLDTSHAGTGKMIIGDFSKYAMGVRTGALVEATTTAGEAFEKHQVWVKITQRIDFVTLDDSAFHILTGITT